MKFIINREKLIKSLSNVSRILSGKTILPILYNFKFTLTSNKLEILSYNGETAILDSIDVESDDGGFNIKVSTLGECLVNLRVLDIVRKMRGDEISFDCIDDSLLIIDDGNSSFKLNTIPSKEFPNVSIVLSGESISVDAKEFSKAINQVSFAASNKDATSILTSVNIRVCDRKIALSATDTARLARKTISVESTRDFNVNVHSKIINDIARLCENIENVIIGFEERRIYFKLNKLIVFTTLISGDYPNLAPVLNYKYSIDLHTNAQEVVNALERISLIFIDKQSIAKIKISMNEFKITSKSPQFGSVVENIYNFNFDSQPFEINVDCNFIIQAIRAIGKEDIVFKFTGETKPLYITSESEPNLVQVVTPLRVVG